MDNYMERGFFRNFGPRNWINPRMWLNSRRGYFLPPNNIPSMLAIEGSEPSEERPSLTAMQLFHNIGMVYFPEVTTIVTRTRAIRVLRRPGRVRFSRTNMILHWLQCKIWRIRRKIKKNVKPSCVVFCVVCFFIGLAI
ncbi:uncharacterized protein LOC129919354 [Episyrphus balteatus]|uniref:uncharacterized protein LOC129919354 n=1 Tax=Episyrphus balteatus TaxID=286459 RepID=UPI0024868457|nr:uncharacterized protein LOC129919354 [Episyrphus balteatus]